MKNVAWLMLALVVSACPPPVEEADAGVSVVDAGDLSCRTMGCAVGFWCDSMTGSCASGCDAAEDCTAMETCNTTTHVCECAGGFHRCGTACVRNDAVATCGARCTACPTDPLGTATCAAAMCEVTCNANTLDCGGACSACPAGAATTQCNASQCEAASCAAGRLLCRGQCPTCPAGASATQCAGSACEASACGSGRLLCGGQCPQCPAQAMATGCNGSACVATACSAGFVVCGGACVACAAGQAFCCKEGVTPALGSGPDHMLALDANDSPVIAFQDAQSVKLARRGPAGFVVQTIESGGVGRGVSVTVDANGVAHVAYNRNQFPYALTYARVPVSGAPTLEVIASTSITVVGATSIAFDEATGEVHVGAYIDGRGYYARRASAGGWLFRRGMFDGNQINIALASGVPHLIASSNASVGVQASVLSHGIAVDGGFPDGGLFAQSTVNSTVGVSDFHEASLALDESGTPWVSFQHPSFRDLRLSTRDGGAWVSETVTTTFAESTSLQWFNGRPHIAFIGTSNFIPRYAVKTDAGWNISTIDPKPITVGTVSLKVDSTGAPHLTMWDPDPAVRRVIYVH